MTGTAAEDQPTGASLGEKLRVAREQRALSLDQVADAMHLDEAIIVALEQGHFETLGAPVYVRGHLKAYAQLLGLSAEEIVGNFQAGTPKPIVAPALQRSGVAPATINPVLLAGGALAILLGLLLGIYVLFDADDPGDIVAAEDSIGIQIADAPVRTASSVEVAREAPMPDVLRTVALPEIVIEPQEAVIEAEEVAAPSAETKTPAPRPVATMRLGLQFNQESWVEISDANRRLLFGLQREGYRREVTGEPPFNLLIGNAHGVALTIDDEPFDVPASRMRGKVARFEITGNESE
jgi:cytoskeleton protein RodZ